ncbi:hypothetical protein [Streptomyces lydicus]|uniref:hypothetical protein n=1 Tax=Streptomyces lydicus TaxID=47763 RepID=UPI0037B1B0C3
MAQNTSSWLITCTGATVPAGISARQAARSRLLELTEQGRAATRAADEAARAAVAPWRESLGEERFRNLVADLTRLAPRGPIRPTW